MAAILSCCLQLKQKPSTVVLASGQQDPIWQFPDPVLGNDAYKSPFSPKFDTDYLKTLRIQILILLEQFGSNLRRK